MLAFSRAIKTFFDYGELWLFNSLKNFYL